MISIELTSLFIFLKLHQQIETSVVTVLTLYLLTPALYLTQTYTAKRPLLAHRQEIRMQVIQTSVPHDSSPQYILIVLRNQNIWLLTSVLGIFSLHVFAYFESFDHVDLWLHAANFEKSDHSLTYLKQPDESFDESNIFRIFLWLLIKSFHHLVI